MPSSIALYYPWMHFQDDNWLKLALLTWDGIVRVRPDGVDDRDDDIVRQIRAESGFLHEIVPSRADLAIVTSTFLEVINTDLERLRAQYSPWNDGSRFRMSALNGPPGYPARPDNRRFWAYCGRNGPKIDNELHDILVDTGLAVHEPSIGPAGSAHHRSWA